MKRFFQSHTVTTGLAIFSMFFGAGNLMFPIKLGQIAGNQTIYAISGLLITAVLLPLLGLVSIILFNGSYNSFFNRMGKVPASIAIFFCMLIIGPLVAMPRIVTLSHIMIAPFIGDISLPIFTLLFLGLTFLGTYKESRILDLLGYVISPALLISLAIIIVKGFWFAQTTTSTNLTPSGAFLEGLTTGYMTLDVLGAIFFSSVVLNILKKNIASNNHSTSAFALTSLYAGLIATTILAFIYIAMSYLGAYYGTDLMNINEGQIFSVVSSRILGANAAIIIAIAVLMACYSTIVALAAVFSEYIQKTILRNRISFPVALFATLLLTAITSNLGLSSILTLSKPIILITYPSLIVLTLMNIGYKLFDIKILKPIIFITLLLSIAGYFFW